MRRFFAVLTAVPLLFALAAAPGGAAEEPGAAPKAGEAAASEPTLTLKVPLGSPLFSEVPAALVNGDPITVGRLEEALSAAHQEAAEAKLVPKIDTVAVLNRLVNARLMIQEARTMGLDDLPEVKEGVAAFKTATLRQWLAAEGTRGAVPDPAEVERIYRESAMEWKIRSVMFEKEDDAKKMEEALKGGEPFESLADKARKEGTAKGDDQGNFIRGRDLQPQLEAVVKTLKVGAVSPIVQVGFGRKTVHVLFKLEDTRVGEDPAARQSAVQAAEAKAKVEARAKFLAVLEKQYATRNRKVFDGLDFEAKKPGFEALLKDKRELVQIKGEKAITVADLAEALKEKFYHGAGQAIESKRVNKKKEEVLSGLIEKRLLDKEALRRGIDKTKKFLDAVQDNEDSVVFGLYVQKALIPDARVSPEEIQAYYDANAKDFTYPEMIRLRSLAFDTLEGAQAALEKLKKGAEFAWVKANAEGQMAPDTQGLLTFDGSTLLVRELAPDVVKALSGAVSGDERLYATGTGPAYVLAVEDRVAARPQPLDEVKQDIAEKVFRQKLSGLVEERAKKLRDAAKVFVYVAG